MCSVRLSGNASLGSKESSVESQFTYQTDEESSVESWFSRQTDVGDYGAESRFSAVTYVSVESRFSQGSSERAAASGVSLTELRTAMYAWGGFD